MEKVSIDPREYVVFDVETNGLKSKKDDLPVSYTHLTLPTICSV